jgi:hypothetical protein
MTTDKVRVYISMLRRVSPICEIFYGEERLNIQYKGWTGFPIYQREISMQSDNWIDITLPEKIDGEKKFSVQIWHDGLTWKAVMKNRYDKFRDMMVKGIIPTIYELPVTVY